MGLESPHGDTLSGNGKAALAALLENRIASALLGPPNISRRPALPGITASF
jgi:hypothetical protein